MSEIAEPSVRGILTAIAGVSYAVGAAILYAIGNVFNWRQTALIVCSIPIATILFISMVPETPMWLLTRKRKGDALKSLQWLRGWVGPEHVQEEFDRLQRYAEESNCSRYGKETPSLKEKICDLKRRNTLKPTFIITMCFFFASFNAVNSMRAYYVQIFDKYNMPLDSGSMTVYVGVAGVVANIFCSGFIKVSSRISTRRNFLCIEY